MTGSAILDTAIGLVFLFLLLGLICTAVQELLASWARLRSRNLQEGIRRLLDARTADDRSVADAVIDHPLIQTLYAARPAGPLRWLTSLGAKPFPSYLPASGFALALMDVIASGPDLFHDARSAVERLPASNLRDSLRVVLADAGTDAKATRQAIEDWYDAAMDRVAGWYKRKAQLIAFLIATVLVLGLNVDAIHVGKQLWNDAELRAVVAASAAVYVAETASEGDPTNDSEGGEPGTDPSEDDIQAAVVQEARQRLDELGLPIGWPDFMQRWDEASGWWLLLIVLQTLAGWLITAVAVSLGAPFWFDLLQRFVSMRGAGGVPLTARESSKPR